MFKLLRYNCNGYNNLFTYEFFQKIYILQGDFNNSFNDSFYFSSELSKGMICYNNEEIIDKKKFVRKQISLICPQNNFINYLDFKQNLEMELKFHKENKIKELEKILNLFGYKKKIIYKKINKDDYYEEIMLGVLKAVILDVNIILVNLSNDNKNKEINNIIIEQLNIINKQLNKIFIISDQANHIHNKEVIFMKYFQGFISESLKEYDEKNINS